MGDIIDYSGTDPKFWPCNEISEDARRAIASINVDRYVEGTGMSKALGEHARTVEIIEFKLWDKTAVLLDAAKARELFKERIDTGKAKIVGIEVITQPRWFVTGNGDHNI